MIHARIVSALSDPGFFPRLEAIETLGRIGDTSVIPALEAMATREYMADREETQYLRTEAQASIEKIRQRVASKPWARSSSAATLRLKQQFARGRAAGEIDVRLRGIRERVSAVDAQFQLARGHPAEHVAGAGE